MNRDDFSYWVGANDKVVPMPNGTDLRIGPLIFYRDRNPDGLPPKIIDATDGSGKAIRLAVKTGTHMVSVARDNMNDRCELREAASPFGTDAWYGFSIRIPSDFPNKPLRCVIAQVKLPYDDRGNGSPAFSLRIDEGQWVATVEHLYEKEDERDHRFLSAAVNGACGLPAAPAYDHHDFSADPNLSDLQVRAVLATDAAGLSARLKRYEFSQCTTGVKLATFAHLPPADGRWSDFILHIAPSGEKNRDGIVELYAEGVLVAQAWAELGYALEPGQTQYFKIGPYRNNDPAWGKGVAAVEVRDIRRGRTKLSVDLPDTGEEVRAAASIS